MAASGENGGEILLAPELLPVASLTTVLNYDSIYEQPVLGKLLCKSN